MSVGMTHRGCVWRANEDDGHVDQCRVCLPRVSTGISALSCVSIVVRSPAW